MRMNTWQSGVRKRIAGVVMALGAMGAGLWLASCAPVDYGGYASPRYIEPSPAAPSVAGSARDAEPKRKAEERPGLATGFGKRIRDEWQKESFLRAGSGPAGTGMVYYNNKDGIEAMTGYKYRTESVRQAAGGLVEWGIKSGVGFCPTYASGGERFVQGRAGSPYSIYVKNRCKSRVEVVLSVDGLDVIDGKPASFRKRGYVIDAGKSLEVKGWRTGWDSVARFEFSSVGASYANQRHGNTRNVGVIGIAVFGEKGVDPWKWMPDEVHDRKTANPFATER